MLYTYPHYQVLGNGREYRSVSVAHHLLPSGLQLTGQTLHLVTQHVDLPLPVVRLESAALTRRFGSPTESLASKP